MRTCWDFFAANSNGNQIAGRDLRSAYAKRTKNNQTSITPNQDKIWKMYIFNGNRQQKSKSTRTHLGYSLIW